MKVQGFVVDDDVDEMKKIKTECWLYVSRQGG